MATRHIILNSPERGHWAEEAAAGRNLDPAKLNEIAELMRKSERAQAQQMAAQQ